MKEINFKVTDDQGEVKFLNELEFFGNILFANVYLSNKIVAINIDNGTVIGFILTIFCK